MSDKRIINVRPAGDDHQVVTVEGKFIGYMKKPCPTRPWRVDAVGEFPAEAFRHSAPTAYDAAMNVFACHASGVKRGKTCAGFLLRGADHNLGVRIGYATGRYAGDVTDGGHELHESYRAMAVANGVDPDEEVLKQCRP